MKSAIKKIDRALKKIYQIEFSYVAENFLIQQPVKDAVLEAASSSLQGALYIKPQDGDLTIGIYLNPEVRGHLSGFKKWQKKTWTAEQFNSFATAAEEISHFRFLLFHAEYGRAVSQFELELQGEIDKFVLSYFANQSKDFQSVYDQLFMHFKWAENLTNEQKNRYRDAHYFAKRFIKKLQPHLLNPEKREKGFSLLRSFYRQSASDRITFLNA